MQLPDDCLFSWVICGHNKPMLNPLSIRLLACAFLSALLLPVHAQQQTLPKWEIGLGPGLVSYPDYPGSKEQNNLIVPFPYITYRSDAFTIDSAKSKTAVRIPQPGIRPECFRHHSGVEQRQ